MAHEMKGDAMEERQRQDDTLNSRYGDRTRASVVIIGAGQAGLAVGRCLAESGVDALILDGAARIGDVWRHRWDNLRLFTAAERVHLPGYPFPGDPNAFPTKDEVADYLEEYARRSHLRVRLNTRVDSLERDGKRFVITAGASRFEADQVVVATGPYQVERLPSWAPALAAHIAQVHSSSYKNASQLPPGDILVVGAGNTGVELALEAAAGGHRVWLAGRDVGHVPSIFRFANGRLFWFLATRVFTRKTFIGRRFRASIRAGHAGPIVRIRPEEITAAGIQRVGRIEGTRNGLPLLQEGRMLDVAGVVWCAGFGLDFSWIKLPILDADGYPRHDGGRVVSEPGLYFVGLPFLNSLSSSTLVGVGRDAAFIASWVTMRAKTGAAPLPTRVAAVQA
jgi:putative flavoprotein involved in K+ transport